MALEEIAWSWDGSVYDDLGFPCVTDHDNMVVCCVTDDGIYLEQQEARARLIAAAPDLLKACKAMFAWAEMRPDIHPWDAWKMAEAAIAKAEAAA